MLQDKFQVLEDFLNHTIEIHIFGEQDEDHPPVVKKTLKKLAPCPDQTHLRIYFDDFYFIAVPVESDVNVPDNKTVIIHDTTGNLYYKVKKVA